MPSNQGLTKFGLFAKLSQLIKEIITKKTLQVWSRRDVMQKNLTHQMLWCDPACSWVVSVQPRLKSGPEAARNLPCRWTTHMAFQPIEISNLIEFKNLNSMTDSEIQTFRHRFSSIWSCTFLVGFGHFHGSTRSSPIQVASTLGDCSLRLGPWGTDLSV